MYSLVIIANLQLCACAYRGAVCADGLEGKEKRYCEDSASDRAAQDVDNALLVHSAMPRATG
jgi:hypothetical protein